MASGDLVIADYMLEYNGIALGAGTNYELIASRNLFGYEVRSQTTDRFGQHGGTSGRHYAKIRNFSVDFNFIPSTATEFETRRAELDAAFGEQVDPEAQTELVIRVPGAVASKKKILCRPTRFRIPYDRDFALQYVMGSVSWEAVDPRWFDLEATTVVSEGTFNSQINLPTINGTRPTPWILTLLGPASDIALVHSSGRTLDLGSLAIGTGQSLQFNSGDSTIKLDGVEVSINLSSGFAWFDLEPGSGDWIRLDATGTTGASFIVMTYRPAYWTP